MLRERFGKFLVSFLPKEYTSEDISEATTDIKAITIKKVGLTYSKNSKPGSYSWETPEGFNFADLEQAYLTDSYIRQALDKYSDFMFKAGWDLVGKNQKSVDYIRSRFRAMALSTQKPIDELLGTIADELVKYHNVFIVKGWAAGNYQYPGKIKVSPGLYTKTVAGYFILPTSSITIARDLNGKVLQYQQTVAGQTAIVFKPEDIIHIAIDQQPGRGFGFPPLAQVIDDVKILRQLEELVHKMVFKHINPLVIYTVGLPNPGLTATDDEIEEAATKMNDLLMDGGLVIPERHKIETLKVTPLDIRDYLTYFENRVFTGLSVSSTIMGRGDQANKSTSDNLDQMFKDKVKAYQRTNAAYIDQSIVTELLFEGGFDPITKPEDMVYFKFKEIDLNAKIAEENHNVQMFTQNAITHEELRARIGMDPVSDEARLYFNMISAAQAAADAANAAGTNKDQPTNQSGTASAPKASLDKFSTIEALLEKSINVAYKNLLSDIKAEAKSSKTSPEKIKASNLLCGIAKTSLEKALLKETKKLYHEGYSQCYTSSNKPLECGDISSAVNNLHVAGNKAVSNMIKDLSIRLKNIIIEDDSQSKIVALFESREYKLNRIIKQQANSAYNNGFRDAAERLEIDTISLKCQENSCDVCSEYSNSPVKVKGGNIPPHHVGCKCKLYIRSGIDEEEKS